MHARVPLVKNGHKDFIMGILESLSISFGILHVINTLSGVDFELKQSKCCPY